MWWPHKANMASGAEKLMSLQLLKQQTETQPQQFETRTTNEEEEKKQN